MSAGLYLSVKQKKNSFTSMRSGRKSSLSTPQKGVVPGVCENRSATIGALTSELQWWLAESAVSPLELFQECCITSLKVKLHLLSFQMIGLHIYCPAIIFANVFFCRLCDVSVAVFCCIFGWSNLIESDTQKTTLLAPRYLAPGKDWKLKLVGNPCFLFCYYY